MDIKKLQSLVIDALEDVKAQDIVLFDTVHLTSLFDRIVVASGTSNRQTKALAASVRDKVKDAGGDVVGVEGEDTGEWVLVDLGDMIVHIMQPAIRQYYRLEEIWGDKPVKLGAAKRKSTPEAAEAKVAKPKSKHLASTQEAPEVKPVKERKAPAKKAAPAEKKPAAKKPAASKAVGKTVKVAPTKSEEAAVKALKAQPAKRKVAKPAADEAPVKKVIKRVVKKAAE
ncbi:MAG: ribosome silencing factor [Pseudomonadota bacterium]